MDISLRSILTAGVSTVAASAIVMAPSVVPPPSPAAPAIVTANVQPTALAGDFFSQLFGWWQPIFWPSEGQAVPTPPPSVPIPTQTSIASSLEGAYHVIEPWVRYGFELAAYAVGWVPYVGWLSGQINILYNFGEGIVHAIVHNTLDWLDGDGNFVQNVGDGIAETVDAFIQLGIDEWNFFLPPLPPLPPLPFAASAAAANPLAATNPAATTLAGSPGNVVAGVSHALTSLSQKMWSLWNPAKGGIDDAVSAISYQLSHPSWIDAASTALADISNAGLIPAATKTDPGVAADVPKPLESAGNVVTLQLPKIDLPKVSSAGDESAGPAPHKLLSDAPQERKAPRDDIRTAVDDLGQTARKNAKKATTAVEAKAKGVGGALGKAAQGFAKAAESAGKPGSTKATATP